MKSSKKIKVIQFADTHLGKTLYNSTRKEETQAILNEIVKIAHEEECDFFVHAGDVYDVFNPPSWAVKMFNHFLLRLDIPGVIVSGNHDSRSKLEEHLDFYELLNIKLVTSHSTTDNVFALTNDTTNKTVSFGAIPWVASSSIIDFSEKDTSAKKIKYSEAVKKYALALCKNLEKTTDGPKFLVTHAMLDSAIADGSEKALTIMDTYTVPKNMLSKGIDYAAIGHIHRGQEIDSPCPATYSGSPRAETFGDKSVDKHVVIVEFIEDDNGWIYDKFKRAKLSAPKALLNLEIKDASDLVNVDLSDKMDSLIKLRAPSEMKFDFDLKKFIKDNPNIIHVEYIAILEKHKVLEVDQKKVSSPDGMLSTYLNYIHDVKKQTLSDANKESIASVFSSFQEESKRSS